MTSIAATGSWYVKEIREIGPIVFSEGFEPRPGQAAQAGFTGWERVHRAIRLKPTTRPVDTP